MKTIFALLLSLFAAAHVFGQANTTLSNLVSPTAINQTLLPNSNATRDLGSSTLRFDELFCRSVKLNNLQLRQGTSTNGTMTLSSATPTISGSSCLRNTLIGFSSGNALASTAQDNTALGFETGLSITTALKNTLVGSRAGRLTTASHNTFIGADAGPANITGSGNTFIGASAGTANTTGQSNVAIGNLALNANTNGFGNVAIGQGTAISNTGNSNVIVGQSAGFGQTSGDRNILIGSGTGGELTTGDDNTFVGHDAGVGLATGNFNVAIGMQSEFTADNINSSVVIGNFAKVAISNAMAIGGSQQSKWGFGIDLSAATSSQALIVGSHSLNGNGAFLTTGGAWTNTSSRWLKDDIQELDPSDVLAKVNSLELCRWKYSGTDEFHIGPMAEEFHDVFDVGVDDQSISTIDPAGVALVSVKALSQKQGDLMTRVEELERLNEEFARMNNDLLDRLRQLEARLAGLR